MSERVKRGDPRLHVEDIKYPGETGDIHAHYARPKGEETLPGVVVISEIWGLVPHIEDVARRAALEGFLALAPDPLSHLGGTPKDTEEAVKMMRGLDAEETTKNLVAAVEYLKTHPQSTGKVGVTGFCWGGGMTNQVAVNTADVQAAAPFYGRQPAPEDVPRIKASILAHYAEDDERINAGIPAFEAALKEAGIEHEVHTYKGTKHGFYNDTGQRYHEEAAKLAWGRTMAFFKEKLKT
ncbi:MAG: dienelactone hydrolase family protein [Candidatus Bathyarchaeota archaeon]|nr:MAG: dienelactone hydrolase family protein [Candidatus Bathyarchaeota archaeon]